jgi:hypothetical protein
MASALVGVTMAALFAGVIATGAFLTVATAFMVGGRLAARGILPTAAVVCGDARAPHETDDHDGECQKRVL